MSTVTLAEVVSLETRVEMNEIKGDRVLYSFIVLVISVCLPAV